jgi:hypothetical protein
MSTVADLEYAHLGGLGAVGLTLDDRRLEVYLPDDFTYWATLSTLTPVFEYSLTDHRREAMRLAEALTPEQAAPLSSADLAVLYWTP